MTSRGATGGFRGGRRALSAALFAAGLALAVFGVSTAAALLYSGLSPIHSDSGVRFLEQVEQRAEGDGKKLSADHISPLAERLTAALVTAPETGAESAHRALSALFFGLLATLLFLAMGRLVPWPAALAGPLLLLLQPQLFQRLMESVPYGTMLFFLLAPSLLLMVALDARATWARLLLCGVAGSLAGAAVFAHHLGLWAAAGTMLGFFAAAGVRYRRGRVELAPVGFEFLLLFGGFLVAFVLGYKLTGGDKKAFLDYLFGPFHPFHAPFAVAGTVYREVTDGGPPLWTALYLLLVRTPLPVLVLAGVGLARAVARRGTLPTVRLWLPAGPFLAVLVVAIGSGSPFYLPGVNLLAFLCLVPAMLASLALGTVGAELPTQSRLRWVPVALAALVAGHLVWVDARHLPHPSSFANVIGGGTGGFLARGNDLYVEATLDRAAAEALLESGRKLSVVPWGGDSRRVLSRFAASLGHPRPSVRGGGALPTLVFRQHSAHWGRLLQDYCNGSRVAASLTVDGEVLWCLIEPGAGP